ncbi:DUF6940 family protein [endosymbiont GvMRE of Glomus versiforme]|uniref:DUF6940 family protein n=1 Tax=endosymbiont GvMRE of Glomus versiforme TaxID=2039283 RepID=UPI000EC537ED|nr:hypothetical protein [endosymbiont GvMRE of Glomus versiforme]RHZ35659.1 hypothetical protein GvMRE_IIg310 [endosymbiont GvMRE of Glomus versiforme]
MNYDNSRKKKYWIAGSLLIIVSIIGIVYYVFSKDNKKQSQKREKEQKSVDIQQLKTQLNSVKNELSKSNTSQKSQLEDKLTEIENKVKNLSSLDKPNIKKLEEEIKEIKEKLEENKPDKDKPKKNPKSKDNPPPTSSLTKYICTKINDNTYKYRFTVDNNNQNCRGYDEVSFGNFLGLLKDPNYGGLDKDFFQKAFQGALKDANSKFPAYFWKCPPVSQKALDKPFEFVVIKSKSLEDISQDYYSFVPYLTQPNVKKLSATSFPNNRNPSDAILVIPTLRPASGKKYDYKNISQFTKSAPEEQQQALWKLVAEKLSEELSKDNAPRWLNTHGLGVYYFHVRIDESNRYYSNYKEYEKWE